MTASALLLLCVLAAQADEEQPDPLARAFALFAEMDLEIQQAMIQDIHARLAEIEDPGLADLLDLRERARRELAVKPWPGACFFEPSIYAPVQQARSFVPAGGPDAAAQYELIRPWENAPQYFRRVRYDYARNHAFDLGSPPAPSQSLADLLYGYPPDADLLIAWLEQQFDHERSLDAIADYFEHAYCDRAGNCYSEITIYDAFASQSQVEMSDVDVIAYARLVLRDRSYVSPIPPDARRQRLYDRIRDGFLDYFKSRVLTEAAANLFVNPETPLRDEHEGLRNRLLVTFALADSSVERIRARLIQAGDRDSFIAAIDALTEKDAGLFHAGEAWQRERNRVRWLVANAARSVLRERGCLAE
ncbi:MAG: hypothetical protein HY812_03260 [Planctomycetes bacterium]|nr:hypothetical protein [Planctomycetota bacterium]